MSKKAFLALAFLPAAILALAQVPAVSPILPDSLKWTSPPAIPGLKGAWVIGAELEPGMYAQRVVLEKGARIPAHTHPDTRYSTILSGTLYVAFGPKPADGDFVAVPAGAVYVAPAGQPHVLWARYGEVIYQEAGNGPTATIFLD